MVPLRLVLDTNVVVTAALNPDGIERAVLLLAMMKPARLYVSRAILAEYDEVLARRELRIRRGLRRQLLQLIRNRSYNIKPVRHLEICRDPADNIFVECADAARADYLVTGNLKHFPAYWKNTKMVKSREFIDLIAPHLMG